MKAGLGSKVDTHEKSRRFLQQGRLRLVWSGSDEEHVFPAVCCELSNTERGETDFVTGVCADGTVATESRRGDDRNGRRPVIGTVE